jgi:preprotein translocase subunit SecD
VPGSLRLRVTEVPFEPERASHGRWLLQRRRLATAVIVLGVVVLAGVLLVVRPPGGPGNAISQLPSSRPSGPLPSSSASPSPGTTAITYQLVPVAGGAPDPAAVASTVRILTARAQELGIAGVSVIPQPPDEVLVTLPAAELGASRALGTTGLVEFVPLPPSTYGSATTTTTGGPLGVGPNEPLPTDPTLVPLFDGSAVTSAVILTDQSGVAVLDVVLDGDAATKFATYTAKNVGNFFAIVLDGTVVTAPTVASPVSGGQLDISLAADGSGRAGMDQLVAILKFGALPFPIRELSGEPAASPGTGSPVP